MRKGEGDAKARKDKRFGLLTVGGFGLSAVLTAIVMAAGKSFHRLPYPSLAFYQLP